MGVKFGTSGLRGLAEELTVETTTRYVVAFAEHLQRAAGVGQGQSVCVGWDLRGSSPRIALDVARALASRGLFARMCGHVPTQALALRAMSQGEASLMITGSHIPADRNGIKFYLPSGEISKADEVAIAESAAGGFGNPIGSGICLDPRIIGQEQARTRDQFIDRYRAAFAQGSLSRLRVGVYQHSSVARDMLYELLAHLGAEVSVLGREDQFVPVDTEAVSPQTENLLKHWAKKNSLNAIVSADGDGDRPLVADEAGVVVRGDVLGVLTSAYVKAGVVVTPVTSNSGVELAVQVPVVRTRVGSPFVISGMEAAMRAKLGSVVGFEANGGFLNADMLKLPHGNLSALPTRDSFLPILVTLATCVETGQRLSQLVTSLGLPLASSTRIENFDIKSSNSILEYLSASHENVESFFAERARVFKLDETDGLRITLEDRTIVHFRASGNAPEFRIYVEADTNAHAKQLLQWSRNAVQALNKVLNHTTSEIESYRSE